MGRFFQLLILLSLFLLIQVAELNAQNKAHQVKLNQLSKTYSVQFQQEKEQALKLADSLGIPIRHEFENGRVTELRRFVNGRPVYATTFNADGADLLNTDEVYSGGAAGLSLSGNGQTLGIWDAGIVRDTHAEFSGRVTVIDNTASVNNHATRVAGTMIASGLDSDAKGMAFEANLNSYDWNDDHGEMVDAAAGGLLLSVHPYGYEAGWNMIGSDWYWQGDATATEDFSFGFYDETFAKVWDTIAFNAPNYLIITPAGNQRGDTAPSLIKDNQDYFVYETDGYVLCSNYDSGNGCNNNYEDDGGTNGFDSITYNALAKNVITVGSVDTNEDLSSDSGLGPTDDGRIKPDIVAKGVDVYSTSGSGNSAYSTGSGTSFSAPMIGGSIGLLLEHQENLQPGETLLSSTLKALVLHTAKDLGNPGPDYTFGWGLMDTQKAAEVMSLNNSEGGLHIKELTLQDGETISFTVQASGSEDLRITMAWTDPPGTPAAYGTLNPTNLMLVNDLDLQLEDQSSTTHQPYTLNPSIPGDDATTGDNIRDNIEMVNISAPTADEIYTVTITHKNSLTNGSQNLSLIITGNEGVDYQQQITGTEEGWRFFSSPLATTYQEFLDPLWTQGSTNSDYPPAPSSNVRTFDGSNDSYPAVSDLQNSVGIGSGFAVFVYEDDNDDGTPDGWSKTVTVNGIENLNDVDVSDLLYSGTPSDSSFTLLGNPFATTIDFDEFVKNSEVGNIVYVYDHDFQPEPFVDPDASGGDAGGGFRAWNGSGGSLSNGLIAPFQGFFVSTHGSTPTLTIPTTAKTSASSTFHKEGSPTPVIQIAAQINGKYSADTWFSFSDSGSLEKNENDAPYLYPLDYKPFLSLRSEVDDIGYLIKNLPVSLEEPLKIPISVDAWQPDNNGYIPLAGSVELVWPEFQNIPSTWTLTLSDHQNGSVIDMKKSDRYFFSLSESKAKVKSLPYSMKLKTVDKTSTADTRFTLTIYPEPLAINQTQETPSEFNLEQNYPNPFNPSTVIRYALPETSSVELDIYTIDGQKVATLVNESQNAGNHTITFDGSNLSSGVYIYRLTTGQFVVSKKMVLIK
ncbi:S8 family peptidase [Rhodohalobacter sp. 614A]|uniref:S8 family peptidase n=1 Tax=Rhodohalobacter sp. 614A TaxID=2908649 RepID=UPI001F2D166D|nr:S8 family peptidase [Rhodohalobacter sp. 614A]